METMISYPPVAGYPSATYRARRLARPSSAVPPQDGSTVWVTHNHGPRDAFALTAEQQKAIALDPAVALPGK
ncbi:hypothetical protein GA0070613_1695 [Micromonospora inositola]|uniref:Uncharacterized protein n=1 Tax=Micromonospora inositola TaxID=47865 RepID=A0A1C5HR60_9ACTN|nr:hypothetical protein GA0070613_1695 [Micromonospora inositola]